MIRGMFVPTTPAAVQEKILATMLGTPEATANGAMAAMFGQTAAPDEVIRAPALAVVAGTGRVPDTAAMKAIVPDFEATQVAGTGHFLMLEKPAEFNQLLQAFLDRIKF
jgi:pimeloyl-ACP methyl ester carboxylesterase